MDWNRLTLVINLVALTLNVLSLLLLSREPRVLCVSLAVNGLVAPFDYARLGWLLFGPGASQHPSIWGLATLAAAALVWTGKLAADFLAVAVWRTWKDVPAGGP